MSQDLSLGMSQNERSTMRFYDDNVADLMATYDFLRMSFLHSNIIDDWQNQAEYFSSLLVSGSSILSLGAGTGYDMGFFTDKDVSFFGIDISAEVLYQASQREFNAYLGRMNMRQLGFRANSFDGIWLWDAIHFIENEDLGPLLKEAGRVLRVDGMLYLRMLPETESSEIDQEKSDFEQDYLLSYWTLDHMVEQLESSGFEIYEVNDSSVDSSNTVIAKRRS